VARLQSKALVWVLRQGASGAEVLLLRRPERRGGGMHPVTGKAEPGEDPAVAAAREAEEETGITGSIADLGYLHEYTSPKGKPIREHAFLLSAPARADVRLSDEHDDFAWMDPPSARASLTWPAHRKSLDLALQRFVRGHG